MTLVPVRAAGMIDLKLKNRFDEWTRQFGRTIIANSRLPTSSAFLAMLQNEMPSTSGLPNLRAILLATSLSSVNDTMWR